MPRIVAAIAIALALTKPLSAHPAPFSYLDVVFRNGGIEGSLVVHVIDVAHYLGVEPAALLNPENVQQQAQRIGDLLRPRLTLRSSRLLSPAWTSVEAMPNDQAIYLHDTNAKSRFNSQIRAASHGCIRTKDVLELATMLLGDDNGEWVPSKIQETLASKKTVQANFVKPLPVYIVYFSVAANTDGTIVNYDDMYKRDNQVIAALLDSDGKGPEKKPAEKVAAK